jgi:hypothetical protein
MVWCYWNVKCRVATVKERILLLLLLFFFFSEFVFRNTCNRGAETVTYSMYYVLCLGFCGKDSGSDCQLTMGGYRV